MKPLILAIAFSFCTTLSYSQQDSALYLRFPQVPPFSLYKVPDSTLFAKADLARKKTVLIIFSPDCDHCQQETRALTDSIGLLKKTQIIMASYMPWEALKTFYTTYNIAAYPSITMGWDKSFFLPPFFKVESLPYIALYDKRGKLIRTFSGSASVRQIAASLAE